MMAWTYGGSGNARGRGAAAAARFRGPRPAQRQSRPFWLRSGKCLPRFRFDRLQLFSGFRPAALRGQLAVAAQMVANALDPRIGGGGGGGAPRAPGGGGGARGAGGGLLD